MSSSRSHLTPLLSSHLKLTTPSSAILDTVQKTEKTTNAVVNRRRHSDRDSSRTSRAIFDVEIEEQVKMPQRGQATINALQQLDNTLLDNRRRCFSQDWRRATGRKVEDESDLSWRSTLSQEEEVTKKSKRRLMQEKPMDELVKNEEMGIRRGLKRAMSSQAAFTIGPASSSPAVPSRLLCYNGSEMSIGVKNASMSPPAPILPTVYSSKHPDLNVISPETVARVLRGDYKERLTQFELLDCRFPYEFQGGTLTGASSLCDPEKMELQLFVAAARERRTRTALIFFCEFSANRAPKMLRHVRNVDRRLHAESYPQLFYPELYLIDGGYKHCFETLQHEICAPFATYVAMEDKRFTDACRREFATWRRRWKPHKAVANCAANLDVTLQVDKRSCRRVRPSVSSVRSLFDEL